MFWVVSERAFPTLLLTHIILFKYERLGTLSFLGQGGIDSLSVFIPLQIQLSALGIISHRNCKAGNNLKVGKKDGAMGRNIIF